MVTEEGNMCLPSAAASSCWQPGPCATPKERQPGVSLCQVLTLTPLLPEPLAVSPPRASVPAASPFVVGCVPQNSQDLRMRSH